MAKQKWPYSLWLKWFFKGTRTSLSYPFFSHYLFTGKRQKEYTLSFYAPRPAAISLTVFISFISFSNFVHRFPNTTHTSDSMWKGTCMSIKHINICTYRGHLYQSRSTPNLLKVCAHARTLPPLSSPYTSHIYAPSHTSLSSMK